MAIIYKIAIEFPTKNTYGMSIGRQTNKQTANKLNLLFVTALWI